MKILHIINDLDDGGAEAVLYRLCTGDKATEHQVVSLMGPGKYGPMLTECGIRVYALGMPRGKITLKALDSLKSIINSSKADAIQTWMYHSDLIGGLCAKFSGMNNIYWGIHHTTLLAGKSKFSTVLVSNINAALSWFVPQRIVCCARKSAEVHSQSGFNATKFTVIPNGYDLQVFKADRDSRERIRESLGIGDNQNLVGFVARYDPLKDHVNLLTALSKLKDTEEPPVCLLVGTGMDKDNAQLMADIERLGLTETVRLLGRRSDIPAIMNALDLHILSSCSEGFPNVLAEAMACGTPCVSTDVGDAADIVGESGLIVPPGNPEALARAISTMLAQRHTDQWSERCAAAQKHIQENFSLETMVSRYHQVWKGNALSQFKTSP